MKAGSPPEVIGYFSVDCEELMFYQYLPVHMPHQGMRIPECLQCFSPLLEAVSHEANDYVYLTAKHMYVGPGSAPNRPGWHLDGFGTEDINYIWSDCLPTEFCIQPFDLSDDHESSMVEMATQALDRNIQTYGPCALLKLDQHVVHRVGVPDREGYRKFAKISVSKSRYNLRGNAHNHLFDYQWEMFDRAESRNHPTYKA